MSTENPTTMITDGIPVTGRGRLVRTFGKVALLVALLGVGGGLVGPAATAPPASAQTASSYVKACFYWPSGAPAGSLNTFVQVWNGSKWVSLTSVSARTNSRGCVGISNVGYNRYFRLVVHHATTFNCPYKYLWTATTNYRFVEYQRGYNLGSYRVSETRFDTCLPSPFL